jgi:hypothetical protein
MALLKELLAVGTGALVLKEASLTSPQQQQQQRCRI